MTAPANGKSYLLMAAWAGNSQRRAQQRLLQVAVDVSQNDILLASYRREFMLVLLFGIFSAAGGGDLIARKGLHPLLAITRAAYTFPPPS